MIRIKRIISELSKTYGVRVYYSKYLDISGEARYWKGTMTLSSNQNVGNILSAFFHELGHIYCYRNNKWTSFHNPKTPDKMSEVEKTLLCKTALRAERWVDNYGKKEMFKYFPNISYSVAYQSQEDIDFLSEYTNEYK
jgi:hypothetical protein